MTSIADLGLAIGTLPAGPTNSVLDVPGMGLGHTTILRDEPAHPAGRGVARTGVTVLDLGGDLWDRPVTAGGAVLNGAGELTGYHSAREWGLVETPVYLTSTMQLGRVYDAACRIAVSERPEVADDVVIPVVGECDDSWLSWAGTMQVEFEDVLAARAAARESIGSAVRPATGSVGAGAGTLCLGWKGGIGTASRILPDGHVVAVLLLTNFGQWHRLTVGGVPIGRILGRGGVTDASGDVPAEEEAGWAESAAAGAVRSVGPGEVGPTEVGRGEGGPPPAGSCIGVVVTDAPVDAAGCRRLATRIGLGLARTGSVAQHGSGEIFLGISTGLRTLRGEQPTAAGLAGAALDPLFETCVDAAEEAVLDSMLNARDTVGQRGRIARALPHDAVLAALTGWPG